jgi:uncharacterized protein
MSMFYRNLGKTNISVSPLGLGTLTLGPFQLNMPVDEGALLITKSIRSGINLLDTAKAYRTYEYIHRALSFLSAEEKENLHIISRSYDYTYEGMEESFGEALTGMGLEKISIFMLHEQESEMTLRGHRDALKYLFEQKENGRLEAVGISTHFISAVEAAAKSPEIDVIFAILNKAGIGIMDGTGEEMERALQKAHDRGKGILIMKALGGGHLYLSARESLEYVRSLQFADSVIIGMQNIEELNYNLDILVRDKPGMPSFLSTGGRKLFIEPWCGGCGMCIKSCPFKALYLENGKAVVLEDRCMLCSYCAGKCPDFCIKIV